jgi:chemotaxis protein CheD
MNALTKYFIMSGQFIVTSTPALISTVLGSCVSVCLWDKVSGLGGMNHYLLPGKPTDAAGDSNKGFTAIQILVHAMLNQHITLKNIEAKIFGGSNSLYKNSNHFRVGEQNVAAAIKVLQQFDITVTAHDVGGHYGRKIVFNTSTGKVRMRLLHNQTMPDEKVNKGFNN